MAMDYSNLRNKRQMIFTPKSQIKYVRIKDKKGNKMAVYPYVDFHNGGTSIHNVDCDNTDVRYTCPYLKFLEKQNYTDYRIDRIGRITIVQLNFWQNYSAKEKNLPYPRNFCLSCPWNRGR